MNKRLQELEITGKYVFHGSPHGDIKILEPRQGRHIPDLSKPDTLMLDGDPAVSATPDAELAIFAAIVNSTNIPFSHTSGFGIRNGEKEFRISSYEALKAVDSKKGYVYVLNKHEFIPYSRDGKPHAENME